MSRVPAPSARLALLGASLLLASGACTSVDERPRVEYIEGGITQDPPRPDGAVAAALDGEAGADPGPSLTARGDVDMDVDAASASPDADVPAGRGVSYQSGTRLRAMTLRIEGSATRLVSWFDPKLGAACSFAPDGEGGTSCLPASSANRYFTDAQCSQPIWARSQPSCPSSSALFAIDAAPADRCGMGAPLALRRLTPSALDPATPLFQRTGDSCSAVTYLMKPELFDASEPLPWSELVKVTRRDRLGGLPDHETLRASDGSSIPGDELDRQGRPCELITLNEQAYCLPTPYSLLPDATSALYADPICTQNALSIVPVCEGKEPAAPTLLLERVGCDVKLFRPSAPKRGFFVVGADKTCKAFVSNDPKQVDQLYMPAEPVALGELTPAKRVLDGSARFRVFTDRDDHDRTVSVEQGYRDTLLNANCKLVPLPGRGYYCPPESAGTLYADAACTRPLLSVRESCSEPGEAFSVTSASPTECGAIGRVVRRGAAFTPTGSVYAMQSGRCTATMPSAALYEYGADVPPEMVGVFPVVTE
jgi:hypothetical protein